MAQSFEKSIQHQQTIGRRGIWFHRRTDKQQNCPAETDRGECETQRHFTGKRVRQVQELVVESDWSVELVKLSLLVS